MKIWTSIFGPKAVSPRKTCGFWRVRVWSCFSKGPQQTHWCALSPFGLLRATFKATMENTALRRDWRSVGGPFGPKWAWHSRGVHIFKKLVFSSFSRIHAIRRVLRSLGGSWASPGTLWGGPGAQRPGQGHGHSEASFRSCFAIRAGNRGSPRPRITTYRCAESFSRDRCVFKTLVKY